MTHGSQAKRSHKGSQKGSSGARVAPSSTRVAPVSTSAAPTRDRAEQDALGAFLANRDGIMTLRDLARMPYSSMRLSARWAGVLGAVPASEQFTILLSGPSGTGKSTVCLELAREFASHGGVLYVCAEERLQSGTVRKRAQIMGIRDRRIVIYDTKSLEHIGEALATGHFRFCIVDSIQEVDVPNLVVMSLIDDYPDITFIFVAQVDASERRSRGSGSWPHRVDIRLWTECDDDGGRWVVNLKNRYAPSVQRQFLFRPAGSPPAKERAAIPTTYQQLVALRRATGKRIWQSSTSSSRTSKR